MNLRALVLDFGGPVLLTPFEAARTLESRIGLPAGTFEWSGPFDPAHDPLWRKVEADEIGQPQYWEIRAREVAAVTGRPGVRQLMALLYPAEEIDSLIRHQACQTVRTAKAAGLRTAVLTNDLALFHDDEWISRVGFLDEVDTVIDGSRIGVLKPDPAAYRVVLDSLQVDAEEAIFVDDHPSNVAGARAVGMPALRFDVTKPSQSFREVGRLLGFTGFGQVCSTG